MIEVIKVKALTGSGTDKNPFRIVTSYFAKDGELLAENDPFLQPGRAPETPA